MYENQVLIENDLILINTGLRNGDSGFQWIEHEVSIAT
jgi:hypothetical protein